VGGKVKVLETEYRGIRFRSRLEARWAVFFDQLEIEYEYEPEGFEFDDGTRYLPDFWLPTFDGGMYVEVKCQGGDLTKARRLAAEKRVSIWLAVGPPACRVYDVLFPDDSAEGYRVTVGVPNADEAYGENRMYGCPGYEEADGRIALENWEHLGGPYVRAVGAAIKARFGLYE